MITSERDCRDTGRKNYFYFCQSLMEPCEIFCTALARLRTVVAITVTSWKLCLYVIVGFLCPLKVFMPSKTIHVLTSALY